MRHKELFALAGERGLPTYGTAQQIKARLERVDAETVPPKENTTMVNVTAGPDTGQDNDNPPAPAPPADQAPAPQAPQLDPRDQQILELQAQLLQMQAAAAAAPGARPTGGDVATPDMIAARLNSEQVFRAEFPMYEGMELGDGLHEKFKQDTARMAVEAGYRTRGGARRASWGTKDGQRTAVYEIYARK